MPAATPFPFSHLYAFTYMCILHKYIHNSCNGIHIIFRSILNTLVDARFFSCVYVSWRASEVYYLFSHPLGHTKEWWWENIQIVKKYGGKIQDSKRICGENQAKETERKCIYIMICVPSICLCLKIELQTICSVIEFMNKEKSTAK